jgi:pimeloyl-ACP methyl ester carboxylesterase
MAEDLKRYCDHHNLKSVILLGHSMGGKVAMHFAANYPDLIEKLVIVDIAPKTYPSHHGDIIQALRSVDFEKVKKRSDADASMSALIPDFGTRQFLLKSIYRKDKTRFGWRFNLDVLGDNQKRVGEHLNFEQPFSKPVLFVKGGKSGYIVDADMHVINQLFSDARLEVIENAGHWLHAEQPEQFYSRVTSFLEA